MYSANKFNTPSSKKLRREKTTLSNHSDSGKESVHVYCRIRPIPDNSEGSTCIKVVAADTLSLTTPDSRNVKREIHFKFKHVFTSYSPQSEVFNHVAYPLLEDLLQGKNGLMLTYGVTGSGKTHTLNGDQTDPGIMPRCIDTIFNTIGDFQAPKCVIKSDKMNGFEIQAEDDAFHDRLQFVRNGSASRVNRKGNGEKCSYTNDGKIIPGVNENSLYAVFVSYVEIYNNSVFDLLDESSGKSLQNKILREDCRKNMYVNGVVEIEVKTAEEAFEVFQSGQNRKRVAATALNAGSSRSHSIFNIRVVQLEQAATNSDGTVTIPPDNLIKVGQLSLVDLAGSERTNRTNNTGMRLKEASSINNSLMTLRTCLEILRENQTSKSSRLVPYRDSRLTFLFKRFFEGDGTVNMIVCINPSVDDFEENIQVLKFAEMSQDVKITKAEINKYTPLKKTITKNKENQTPAKPRTVSSFTLLPPIPMIKLNLDSMDECRLAIDKIINVLKLRSSKGKNLNKEIDERQKELRKKLVNLNQQCVLSTAEMRSLKTMINKEKQKYQNLNLKMTDLEVANQDLNAKNDDLLEAIGSLKNAINEKDLKINQFVLERQRCKQQQALHMEKATQELDAKLRRQRDHLNAAMKAKDEKLKLVKGILDSELPPIELNHFDIKPESVVTSVTSHMAASTPKNATHMYGRNMHATSVPRSRRSRSAGEVWLEHNVIKPCPLGTVMQPTMKKRKSVSKLDKASDITNPKQSKYCLVAQEPDTEGEMETKLYKADIVPTCGGGAQVIFNDIERLKQQSPTRDD